MLSNGIIFAPAAIDALSGHYYRISPYIVSIIPCIPRVADPLFPYSSMTQPSPTGSLKSRPTVMSFSYLSRLS